MLRWPGYRSWFPGPLRGWRGISRCLVLVPAVESVRPPVLLVLTQTSIDPSNGRNSCKPEGPLLRVTLCPSLIH